MSSAEAARRLIRLRSKGGGQNALHRSAPLLAAARGTPEQPGKGAAHKCHALRSWQIPMGDHHPLDWPSENLVYRDSRRATVEETRAPFAPGARIGGDNSVEPGDEAAPPLKPVARKILDQISEKGCAAATVEKHNLG